jgi:hypothetical protein
MCLPTHLDGRNSRISRSGENLAAVFVHWRSDPVVGCRYPSLDSTIPKGGFKPSFKLKNGPPKGSFTAKKIVGFPPTKDSQIVHSEKKVLSKETARETQRTTQT